MPVVDGARTRSLPLLASPFKDALPIELLPHEPYSRLTAYPWVLGKSYFFFFGVLTSISPRPLQVGHMYGRGR